MADAAVYEDGPPDIVAAPDIAQQFVQQISFAGMVSKVMMGVEDGEARVKDLLLHLLQPVFTDHHPPRCRQR